MKKNSSFRQKLNSSWVAGALVAALLFLVVVLISFNAYLQTPPPVEALEQCAAGTEALAPTAGWRFRLDPDDVGAAQAWYDPAFDDAAWDASEPGTPWEEMGYVDYDGVAWYRAAYDIPADWETAYLATVGIDDEGQLWLNGRETPIEKLVELPTGGPVQITYRINDLGGFGGIKELVRVGPEPETALTSLEYVRYLNSQHPEWPMSGWLSQGRNAWTFTGIAQAETEALISNHAAVTPWAEAPLMEIWLLDEENELRLPEAAISLLDDNLPIPQAEWVMDDLNFETTLFTDYRGHGTYWTITTENRKGTAHNTTVLIMAHPVAIKQEVRPIYAAGFDRLWRLWLNGELIATPSIAPAQVGVGVREAVLAELQHGRFPQLNPYLECAPQGDATAVMAFPVSLAPGETWSLTLGFPAAPGLELPDPADAAGDLDDTLEAWRYEIDLRSRDVIIPDQLITNAYKTSVGYLLLALDEAGPHPGPLEHDALWVRDAAYIGATLLSLGDESIVADYIPSLLEYQEENGYVPAIIEPGVGPRPDVEWDAQGQLIYLIAELYRYNGNDEILTEWYPNVKAAAEFIVQLRRETADNPPETRGILPPSRSAEDLGPAEWHHYWDNFWAVAGLENAAFLADELGLAEDAAWMQQEADDLRQSLRAGIEAVMGPEPAYIPNGPEDITSSAMARGSSNSLYPVAVFERDDPLIVRSFDEYYAQWIAPQGGGYKHIYGQLWPYGGLGLARDYVRLGRHDILHEILGWTLNNQTLPGTFAWAEQVDPATGGFSGGDMPHAWAASSFVTLIREMLVMPDGEKRLEIFAGVPGSWLTAGKEVGLRDTLTHFGPLTVETDSTLQIEGENWNGALTLTLSGAEPPAGFRWRLPHLPADVSGLPGTEIREGWLYIPGPGKVELLFE